jgi:hypothetical protein
MKHLIKAIMMLMIFSAAAFAQGETRDRSGTQSDSAYQKNSRTNRSDQDYNRQDTTRARSGQQGTGNNRNKTYESRDRNKQMPADSSGRKNSRTNRDSTQNRNNNNNYNNK